MPLNFKYSLQSNDEETSHYLCKTKTFIGRPNAKSRKGMSSHSWTVIVIGSLYLVNGIYNAYKYGPEHFLFKETIENLKVLFPRYSDTYNVTVNCELMQISEKNHSEEFAYVMELITNGLNNSSQLKTRDAVLNVKRVKNFFNDFVYASLSAYVRKYNEERIKIEHGIKAVTF